MRGFSLIEVLIAAFILTFGLLGIAALYINSLKQTENAYWRTLAISQWIVMTEQQKVGDTKILDHNCSLLPHGNCKYQENKPLVCWGKNNEQQCM